MTTDIAMSTDLVPADHMAVVVSLATEAQALAVVDMLDRARHWLADAVENTGPAEIATAKAEIVTAATYSRQLGLSKEIQQDAREMVRRAEYALGKAISKGQAEGAVETTNEAMRRAVLTREVNAGRADQVALSDSIKPRPLDFASRSELHNTKANILDLAQATPEEFEEAVEKAKSEGDLSRQNLARKIKGQDSPLTRSGRAELIADLAAQGYASRQMPERVGIAEPAIKLIARDYGIEIPADKALSKTRRRNDSNRIVNEIVDGLAGTQLAIELIDYNQLDREQAAHWAISLKGSIQALTTLNRRIKEMTQND